MGNIELKALIQQPLHVEIKHCFNAFVSVLLEDDTIPSQTIVEDLVRVYRKHLSERRTPKEVEELVKALNLTQDESFEDSLIHHLGNMVSFFIEMREQHFSCHELISSLNMARGLTVVTDDGKERQADSYTIDHITSILVSHANGLYGRLLEGAEGKYTSCDEYEKAQREVAQHSEDLDKTLQHFDSFLSLFIWEPMMTKQQQGQEEEDIYRNPLTGQELFIPKVEDDTHKVKGEKQPAKVEGEKQPPKVEDDTHKVE